MPDVRLDEVISAVARRRRWTVATSCSLVDTATLNGCDPQARLRGLLDLIADHPIKRIGERAPRNLRPNAA